jgi:hypothetical protein
MLFHLNSIEEEIFEDIRMMPILIIHMNLEEMSDGLLSKIVDLILFDPIYINIIKTYPSSSKRIFQTLVQYNLKILKYLDDFLNQEFTQETIDIPQLFNLMKAKLSEDISLWKYIPSKFYDSIEIAKALKEIYMSNPEHLKVFHQISLNLRDDLEIAHWALSYSSNHFICLSLRLKDSEDLFMKAIENDVALFKYGSLRLQKNPALLFELFGKNIEQNDLILATPLSLQKNNDFVGSIFQILFDLSNNSYFNWYSLFRYWCLDYKTLLKNLFIRKIVIQYAPSFIIERIADVIKDQRDFFIELFSNQPYFIKKYLKYASKQIKNDKEVVLLAIASSDSNFSYISSRLKNDIDVLFCLLTKSKVRANDLETLLADVSRKSLKHPKIIQILAEKYPELSIKFTKIEKHLQRKVSKYIKYKN